MVNIADISRYSSIIICITFAQYCRYLFKNFVTFFSERSSLFVVIAPYFSNSIFSLTMVTKFLNWVFFHHVLHECKENIFQL